MGCISSVVEGLMYVMEFREIMCRAEMVCMEKYACVVVV